MFNNLGNEDLRNIVIDVRNKVVNHFTELYNSLDFGAYIEAKDYFVSYIFKTDKELIDATDNGLLIKITEFHKMLMEEKGYPIEAIKDCVFASIEDCKRVSNGNWYYYYK